MTDDSNETESALSNTSDNSRFNIWHNISYNITSHTPTGVLHMYNHDIIATHSDVQPEPIYSVVCDSS